MLFVLMAEVLGSLIKFQDTVFGLRSKIIHQTVPIPKAVDEIGAHLGTPEHATNRLARNFTAQAEALRKHRNGGKSKITVEHVTVNEGGQAIVGQVQKS